VRFTVVIPARYQSTRLPGKPLLDIAGKPMIQHVYERARESGADRVIIATDDARVAEAAAGFSAEVCMTLAEHGSGTERLSEVVGKIGLEDGAIVVNLQGDEPLMPPALIHQVAQNLAAHGAASVATLMERIHSAGALFDPHCVKVISDREGYALYFSRAPIPWDRDAFSVTTEELPQQAVHYRHIGLYAYRAGFIRQYVSWPVTELEKMESLEQLRVLWHGHKIHVAEAQACAVAGVDTEADLARVRSEFKADEKRLDR
jgi:3-deoxy-manno-octulosonate cytidylyltransferase (CMP-KDO synthetase)